MLINAANLDALRVGFSALFQSGLGLATSQYARVATVVPATTKEQKYGWLGKMPGVREWIGPRVVHNLAQHDYAIKEKAFELTVGVDRDDIDTDNLGIYSPMFQEMGQSTGSKWEELVWAALKGGFTGTCYDGQSFFDTDHPVLDANGVETSVANTDGGSGTPWFLLCTRRVMKPIILQKRRDFEFVSKTKVDDDHVFMNKEFLYGADARGNVGYGYWQLAWGSKQTLNATNYAIARAALMDMKGDYGRPLGNMPDLLVVPGTLESEARKLLNSEYGTGGVTNEWKGTAELLVVPWLA
ncbi:Mu-like prophage major head subunit gpT family protein [Rhodoplanes sp. TEM]|uniref:Mu-like prophage major head subunit gpT family protein n=1 Tax=Rhodoplanes tepidamans TaxID=200616 RepID=A0ABT5JEP9_RHOTP|nr:MULTISPECIES: Mu-like prophage major head subunit gpT family protein [Rhodoplanes]MDC7787973.1 Mu-like prophage major head subunit gpT family protein [Rhodoplanes tepidamans]MDC7984813.1 Mu-like prophage major head subunit gpT family protein [Rhodoplanes sp. TEM]MDQ0358402.1 phage major head subunit gpT-like protein [Rhodoplanes tepidamans]